MIKPISFIKKLFTPCVALKEYNSLIEKCFSVSNDLDLHIRTRDIEISNMKNKITKLTNALFVKNSIIVALSKKIESFNK